MRACLAAPFPLLVAGLLAASLPPGDAKGGGTDLPRVEAGTGTKTAYSPAALREEIRSLARRGLFDSALALCRRALEFDSNDTYARFMAGKLAPEGKTSAEHFKRVLESGRSGPEAEESRFRLGQYYYAAGKYHLAIPYFRDYLRLYPKGDWREPAHYWMGSACLALAQAQPERAAYLDTGMVYFQRLRESVPQDHYYHALALEGLAKARVAKGNWAGAWEAVKAALDRAPEDERASILLLAAQLRRGVDRKEELRLLTRLAAEHPRSPEARNLRKLNGSSDPARWRAPAIQGAPKASLRTDSAAGNAEPAGSAGSAAPERKPAGDVASTRPPAPSAEGSFTLQLGAFAQAANAQSLAA
ncbi:MAG TPA: tetratricopeptide repeat protein, partial [Fibrobacteria bacterium]|nr:tetratricopeptide repeat protein [Fibrobacteria bacterium]